MTQTQSPSATADGFFYTPFLAQFLSLQKCTARTLIKTPPSSRGQFFLYKNLMVRTLKNTSPLPFGLSPIAQTCIISLQDYTSFARGEVGTHIEKYRSLIMPLRFVRQAVANKRRSRLYYTHKGSRTSKTSELIFELYDESAVFGVWDEERKAQRRTTATCCG